MRDTVEQAAPLLAEVAGRVAVLVGRADRQRGAPMDKAESREGAEAAPTEVRAARAVPGPVAPLARAVPPEQPARGDWRAGRERPAPGGPRFARP